jgi:glycosyltransferase involved in cell wall biosynthesis
VSDLPKITIITPSYNQGEFLEECIVSILAQDYPNLEYILIDAGSTDNTLEIIQKYAQYITYWVSEPDKGQSHAINKGLQIASGEIINWLNADDFYPENTLHTVAKIFQEKKIKCLCGLCQVFENPDKPKHLTSGTDIYTKNLAKTIGWARTDQPATFYHRDALELIGKLDEDLHYLMDRDWWVKFLLHCGLEDVYKVPITFANFRLHPNSKTVGKALFFNQDRDMYFHALAKLWKLTGYANFLEKNILLRRPYQLFNFPTVKDDTLKEKIINYYFLQKADEFYYQGNVSLAKKFLKTLQPNLLTPQDQALYQKLRWRIRFLPQGLVKLIRKWKR